MCFLVATGTERDKGSGNTRESVHSVLRAVPRGLTLGPSLAQDGQLGLWCVGRVLEKGTLLGLEEPDKINRKEKAEVCILVCFKFHCAPYSGDKGLFSTTAANVFKTIAAFTFTSHLLILQVLHIFRSIVIVFSLSFLKKKTV